MDSLNLPYNQAVRLYLEQLEALGVKELYLESEFLNIKPVKATPSGNNREQLQALHDSIRDCRSCRLCEKRKQVVFGVGNPNAELVFVGEAPGADEDRQGIPFVGRAGQLLTKMIEAGMGLSRDEVYICNVIKCRPPENRNPQLDEIAACESYLKQQLDILRPKAIVALGKFAAQTLLQSQTPITRLRGQWGEYQGIPLMPTYHPSYLLRAEDGPDKGKQVKREAWEDLKKVVALLGNNRPE